MDSNSKKTDMESQYEVLLTLGQGSFGTVKLACHLKTEALVAIKMVELSKKNLKWIRAEIATLEKLRHPNIICLFQVLVTSRHVNIITEYIPGGNLLDIIKEDGPMHEEEASRIFGQVVSAVKYCHNQDIVHQDIKAQTILRDEEGNIKIIDFGLAITCRSGTLLTRRCGTKTCFAPELVLWEPYDGKKADVWSLGMLLYFITTGHYPFSGSTMKEMEEKIATGTYDIPTHVSGQLENLIHQILTVPPEMRPSIEDIERHPWVTKTEVNNPAVTDPDYNIIEMLCAMGFDANKILESLQRKKYNESMGAYLILKAQVDRGLENTSTIYAKPVDWCPTPPPSPRAHPSISGLPLKRRASEPNFSLLRIQPSGEHGPITLALSGHQVARSVSMPPIALHYPEKKGNRSSFALYPGAVAAPSVCSSILEKESPVPPDQECDVGVHFGSTYTNKCDTETPSPPQKISRFRRMCKRIRACLSHLCCIPRAPRTKKKRTSSKKVAPLEAAGGRTQ
ncbi:LOW QUALITY PROTEIN: putative sperm motility kinase W [Mus pahari]|uniref:LOW QUALITY PROTEIN: putative sperm motility kinase W n=1 Tax=Mus pahari TaxID=10093 RepID=UPI000A3058C0|nr:LOW QUALITY PROTEIN: putative sperm motility kinase W [Mus pahari]